MKFQPPAATRALACALLLAFCPLSLLADTVFTKSGSKEVGKIVAIHDDTVFLDTDYAGVVKIKLAQVTAFTTDRAVAVRTADGAKAVGIVTNPAPGKLRVTGSSKVVDVDMAKVKASWAALDEDPDVVAKQRKWSYEAAADVNGRSGGERQLSTSYHYKAKLTGPDDTFQYYTDFTRQDVNSQVSADQFKAGADYADKFTPTTSWFARDDMGFDRVAFISYYDIAASGIGYDFVKDKTQTFTGRLGFSYRYDKYTDGKGVPLSSTGADVELDYSKKFKTAQLSDKLAFVPAFENLNNYVVNHEFAYEIPIAKSLWKLSAGVANNFYSKPVGGSGSLETLYFTRLVLVWGAQPPDKEGP